MINRKTVQTLNLKPVTRNMCQTFYVKINTEFSSPEAIRESVTWWQDDIEKLNMLWWVLNYHSDKLDPDRSLRAYVENFLDRLAEQKTAKEQEETDSPQEPEPTS